MSLIYRDQRLGHPEPKYSSQDWKIIVFKKMLHRQDAGSAGNNETGSAGNNEKGWRPRHPDGETFSGDSTI
jgi:hypothetical protein